MTTINQKFDAVAKLSPTEMRNIILDNRSLFPEFDNCTESEITKQVMISSHNMRVFSQNKETKKLNLMPVLSVVFAIGIALLVVLVITGNLHTEVIPAVAGLQ